MSATITRIWHGKTRIEYADEYLEYLKKTGAPDYKSVPGNLSVQVWRRKEYQACHFWTVTRWESVESIKEFAGDDYEKARYYPDDKKYLLEFEPNVTHYETFDF
jgi:heme-degrading monooxygenase HmoA